MFLQSVSRSAYIGSDLAEAGLGDWLVNKVSWATLRAERAWRTQVDIVMAIAIVTDVGSEQCEKIKEALNEVPELLMWKKWYATVTWIGVMRFVYYWCDPEGHGSHAAEQLCWSERLYFMGFLFAMCK